MTETVLLDVFKAADFPMAALLLFFWLRKDKEVIAKDKIVFDIVQAATKALADTAAAHARLETAIKGLDYSIREKGIR
jgi:hypothetical protein